MSEVRKNTKTITDKEGMFIEMLGSVMVVSSNVVTKYCVVIQAIFFTVSTTFYKI